MIGKPMSRSIFWRWEFLAAHPAILVHVIAPVVFGEIDAPVVFVEIDVPMFRGFTEGANESSVFCSLGHWLE